MKHIFTEIYKNNFWKDEHTVSGNGSTLEQTQTVRMVLPQLFSELGVKTLLDVPCGDFYWFKEMLPELPKDLNYCGVDIVHEMIYRLNKTYSEPPRISFLLADASQDVLPKADMIMCRDMLVHFTNAEVMRTLKKFRASGTKYLLATTFPGRNPNQEIKTGEWRPIDLEALRYGLGPAKLLINEGYTGSDGRFADKSLGLWEIN